MKSSRDRGGASGGASAGGGSRVRGGPSAAGPELRQTLLLPLLFERFDPDQPITVLDVGNGVAETVSFFTEFRCRLNFADLYETPGLDEVPDEDAEAHFEARFTELLGHPAGSAFDICLFWDFLNYLPIPALRGFSRALRPHLHRGTMGHGFGAFKATAPALADDVPELGLTYGVRARDELIVRPRSDGRSAAHAHSRKVLGEAFTSFEIVRGTLLQEGAMELLLKSTGR